MIGSLNGTITYVSSQYILLDVGGVGYKVKITKDIVSSITGAGQKKLLYIYTYVREDVLDLYGFATKDDLDLFENLISVSGIGPKTAMGIFSIGSRKNIIDSIIKADVEFFEQVPRLGRKNAQKIIIELKSKLGSTKDLDLTEEEKKDSQEIIYALKSFGFTPQESREALKEIKGQGATTADKIKLALKYLGK